MTGMLYLHRLEKRPLVTYLANSMELEQPIINEIKSTNVAQFSKLMMTLWKSLTRIYNLYNFLHRFS